MAKVTCLGDVHGNYEYLMKMFNNEQFIGADLKFCLGDIVGYGNMPEECVSEIRSRNIICIMGNHERCIIDNVPCRDNDVGIRSLEMTRKKLIMRWDLSEFLLFLNRYEKKDRRWVS